MLEEFKKDEIHFKEAKKNEFGKLKICYGIDSWVSSRQNCFEFHVTSYGGFVNIKKIDALKLANFILKQFKK